MLSEKDATRWSRRLVGVAAVAACSGFALVRLREQRLVAELSGGERVTVLVLSRDVPAGAPLARDALASKDVGEAHLEGRHVRAGALADVVDVRAAVRLVRGEALLWTDLAPARPEATELARLVPPGMRAMSVATSGVAGLLRPGDHVDVVGGVTEGARRALQNLVVLAAGARPGEAPAVGSADEVTLAVTVEQAEALAAAGRGAVTLSLRHPDDLEVTLARERPSPAGPAPAHPEIEHVR